MTQEGDLVPPSQSNGFVRFKLGLTELDYLDYYQPLFQIGLANAPGLERSNIWQDIESPSTSSISTQFILNMTDSTLPVCPAPNCYLLTDTLSFQDVHIRDNPADYLVFSYEFGGVPSNIIPLIGINFTNLPRLAFGVGSLQTPSLSEGKLWLLIVALIGIGIIYLRRD